MEKPVIDGPLNQPEPQQGPASPPNGEPLRNLPTYAWWLVMGLVGLDCFSTLGYLPTIAVAGAQHMAPLAAAAVAVLMLFAALPIYLYVVGRSPHGQGATGLLERHISGWSGKILVLILLGFVATDFVMTRSLSVADAAKHLTDNPHVQSGVEWMASRKDTLHSSLPESLQGPIVDQIFGWWNGQLIITVVLSALVFGLYFYLLRGFTRAFMYAAAAIVALFLLLNGIVIVSGLLYVKQHEQYLQNWVDLGLFGLKDQSAFDAVEMLFVILTFVKLAAEKLPSTVLGLSGFELSMASAPLVRGRPDDNPAQPRGRIRNVRKLLVSTAILMILFTTASVFIVTLLVPPSALVEGGPARHRALAYLAHGGALQSADRPVLTSHPVGARPDSPEDEGDMLPPNRPDENEKPVDQPSAKTATSATDLNPLFGPAFGTLYDLSAVLILCLAGASVSISLRDLLPRYLTRYGMEMHWAHRIGLLLHLFNAAILIVVIAFRASVSHQQGAYATSVLVLLAGAALAAMIDLSGRWRRSMFRPLGIVPLVLVCGVFLWLACWVGWDNPAGAIIALVFVVIVLLTAGLSRWMRSTELRYYGFTFADEESGVRWEAIRRMEFQVLVPHRPGDGTLAEAEAGIRARHRLSPDVPIIFIEAELGDPSDFQHQPLMRIVRENGVEVIRLSQCPSIAHALAAIALEFRDVGRPPEMHFAWSDESPLASNLNFLLWGQGNVPWMVHALIRRTEREPARRPRVVIG